MRTLSRNPATLDDDLYEANPELGDRELSAEPPETSTELFAADAASPYPECPQELGCAEDLLIEQAGEGDQVAFSQLHSYYYHRILRYLYSRLHRRQDAEDLAQQVFLQAWRALPRYRKTGAPFIAWLLAIAHNTVISHSRRPRREYPLDEMESTEWASEEDLGGSAEIRLHCEQIRQTMRHLRPDHEQVLTMRFLDDLSHRDVAAALGKSEAHVRVIQHKALYELRRLLEPAIA